MRFVEFQTTADGGFDMGQFEEVVERSVGPDPGTPAEEVVEEQPRDDQGRFAPVAEAEPEEPEGETEEPDAPVEPDPLDAGYLTSVGLTAEEFADLDERTQAITLAGQRQFVNMRKAYDERQAELTERRRRDEEAAEVEDDFEDYVDPATAAGEVERLVALGQWDAAAKTALDSGQEALFDKVMTDWADDHPYAATKFFTGQAARALQQHLTEQMSPYEQGRVNDTFRSVWSEVKKDRPDLDDYVDEMQSGYVPESVAQDLRSASPGKVKAALELLHDAARGRANSQNAQAAPVAQRRQAEADAALKQGGALASSQHTTPTPPKVVLTQGQKDAAELIALHERETSRSDIAAGLTS